MSRHNPPDPNFRRALLGGYAFLQARLAPRPARAVPVLAAEPAEDVVRQVLVDSLTNWQRKRWARGGYPKDPEQLRAYAKLTRRGQA